jgi:hypothetical protein
MQRIIWWVGTAGLASACIEEHTATRDDEDASEVPDRGPLDQGLDRGLDRRDQGLVDAAFLEPDQGVVDAGVVGPTECEPGGVVAPRVGACIKGPEGWAPDGPVTFTVEGMRRTTSAAACMQGVTLQIGALAAEGHDLWGVDAQGQAWRVFLSIPDDVPPPEGAQVTIQVGTSFGALWEGASGHVVVESGGRLLAAVVAGNSHFLPLLHPELRLEHGDQSCFEEEVESPCTYTGYLLQATAGAERRQLGYTERAHLGPFAVVHAGLLSIGDLGACNAAPESYALAAVRR